MATARELRDRLETLQVELRKAREQLGASERERRLLAADLAESREVVDELRSKLTTAERLLAARRSRHGVEPLQGKDVAIVALAALPGDLERALGLMSSATGLGVMDLRLKLRGGLPQALVRIETGRAHALARALRDNDIDVVVCEGEAPPKRSVQRAVVSDGGLTLDSTEQVAFADLQLAVLGRKTRRTEHTEAERGGLYQPRVREVTVRDETSRDFLWLFASGPRRFELTHPFELEGAPVRLTAAQTLRQLVEVLRGRAPHLEVDDRLVRLASFQQLLLGDDSQALLGELLYASVSR